MAQPIEFPITRSLRRQHRGNCVNRRLVVAIVVFGVALGACSDGNNRATVGVPADARLEAQGTIPEALIYPTRSDEPFASGDAREPGRTTLLDEFGALAERVERATSPWQTDWTRSTVDLGELVLGVIARDPRDLVGGGPIDEPAFEPVARAGEWLSDASPGAVVALGDDARFYPIAILAVHEVINDRFGDIPVAITYCPLCNTALTFDRRVGGEVLRFGTSGLLRNSDLVMWDDATVSLWQQITGEGIVGSFAGAALTPISTAIVSYSQFVEAHPEGLSLSRAVTGIEYVANPYVGYTNFTGPDEAYLAGPIDETLPPMSRVVGVTLSDGSAKAYPFGELRSARVVNDVVGDVPIAVFWGGETVDPLQAGTIDGGDLVGTGVAFDRRVAGRALNFESAENDRFIDRETRSTWSILGEGLSGELAGERLKPVNHSNDFWFAWAAFFPEVPVYLR